MSFSSGKAVALKTLQNTFTQKQTVDGELEVEGALNHDGTHVGFYGAVPVVRAAAIATPTAPSVVYTQAEAAAMKTAVDAIRNALKNVGITL
jgi:hypothetical protein